MSMKMWLLKWTTNDRAEIITRFVTLEDFIDLVVERIDHLKPAFIHSKGSRCLNVLKEELPENEVVVVLSDFAENCQFMIQDEVQGFHWNSSQCTLHPIFIYYKSDQVTESFSLFHYWWLNLWRWHGVRSYSSSHKLYESLFSDGCAGKYKNCKNFLNQTLHLQDFEIQST